MGSSARVEQSVVPGVARPQPQMRAASSRRPRDRCGERSVRPKQHVGGSGSSPHPARQHPAALPATAPAHTRGARLSTAATPLPATTGGRSAARSAPPSPASRAAARAAWRSRCAAQSSGIQQREGGNWCSCAQGRRKEAGSEAGGRRGSRVHAALRTGRAPGSRSLPAWRREGNQGHAALQSRLRAACTGQPSHAPSGSHTQTGTPAHLQRRGAGSGQLRQRPQVGALAVAHPRPPLVLNLLLAAPLRLPRLLLLMQLLLLWACRGTILARASTFFVCRRGVLGIRCCARAAGAAACIQAGGRGRALHARPGAPTAPRVLADDALAALAVHGAAEGRAAAACRGGWAGGVQP